MIPHRTMCGAMMIQQRGFEEEGDERFKSTRLKDKFHSQEACKVEIYGAGKPGVTPSGATLDIKCKSLT